jgi:hypothetical protein
LSWAQTHLDATTTAVILTLEPLVGAGVGVALGDTWTVATLAGGIALLAAVCLVTWTGRQTLPVKDLILGWTLKTVRPQIHRQTGYAHLHSVSTTDITRPQNNIVRA